MFESPIVFIVFNRPAKTQVSFSRIAEMRPARLLVVADGPRRDRTGEHDLCEETRRIATNVTWPCRLDVNFADENLGCRRRVVSGLNWAFEQVEEAIILEDDIIPDPSFFLFCKEMLERYRDDDRIGMITGFNPVSSYVQGEASYYYSRLFQIWGWATWRRVWNQYDERLGNWPHVKRAHLLSEIFESPRVAKYWSRIFDEMHNGTGPDTWDYQWAYTNFIANRLSIVPHKNLVKNIGFGVDATHTVHAIEQEMVAESIDFPLIHPEWVVPSRTLDRRNMEASNFQLPHFGTKVYRKSKRVLKKILKSR